MGWPQSWNHRTKTDCISQVFYGGMLGRHPVFSGTGIGEEFLLRFLRDIMPNYSEFGNSWKGAVNPFGSENIIYFHNMGAVCNEIIMRQKSITDRVSYYGGIHAPRFFITFDAKNESVLAGRPKHNYQTKCIDIPLENTVDDVDRILESLAQDEESCELKEKRTIILSIPRIREKFSNLEQGNLSDLDDLSHQFFNHSQSLFQRGYFIVDCKLRTEEGVEYMDYVFEDEEAYHERQLAA